ncbi:MAG TPA: 50S ribosomal protein L30 [Nitrososphaeraceae archaeon]|jgi:large subunit ribosomal protein L30
MAYLVVRIKGTVNIPYWASSTLEYLNLGKKFNATIVPETRQTLGMLRKVKEVVAWCHVDQDTVQELLSKRGRRMGNKSIDEKDLPKDYSNLQALAKGLAEDKIGISKVSIRPWFALSPPRGGFKKSTKKQYTQDGILGEDKDLIGLVQKMI